MKNLVYCGIILSCLFLFQCSESSESEPAAEPSHVVAKGQDDGFSELKSVCDCFESAIGALDDAIVLRKQYANIEEYQKDADAAKEMKSLLKKWHGVQQYCLTKFGSEMFMTTKCDRNQELIQKREELKALGIKT